MTKKYDATISSVAVLVSSSIGHLWPLFGVDLGIIYDDFFFRHTSLSLMVDKDYT